MTLHEWIRTTSGEPYRPGHTNCAGWAIRWVGEARGVDVSPWLPPEGQDPSAFVAAHGGLINLARRAAAVLGLDPIRTTATRGDVGIIVTREGVEAAAICTGLSARWAVKERRGVAFLVPAAVRYAWSV